MVFWNNKYSIQPTKTSPMPKMPPGNNNWRTTMSTDYKMTIKRKTDNKIIGKVFCNEIKQLIDTSYVKNHNITSHTMKFNIDIKLLDDILNNIENDIKKEYSKIFEKKLLSNTATVDIKRIYDDEILDHEEYIHYLLELHFAASTLSTRITTISEDMLYYNEITKEWEYDAEEHPILFPDEVTVEIECIY